LSTGAQLQTFPYPTASKSFLYSNAFMAKSGAQALTFKSVTVRQTERQTDKKTNCFWPPRRRVKSEPHQTWQCRCTDGGEIWQGGGDLGQISPPLPNFTPIGATCRPCGAKNFKIGL